MFWIRQGAREEKGEEAARSEGKGAADAPKRQGGQKPSMAERTKATDAQRDKGANTGLAKTRRKAADAAKARRQHKPPTRDSQARQHDETHDDAQ